METDRPLNNEPQRVFAGFGLSAQAASRVLTPRGVDELCAALAKATREGMSAVFRGAGRSYGDASLNSRALAIDLTAFRRLIAWDKATGIAEVEPGFTIGDLWRASLPDGFWPAVVPGTMAPTLGGCLAMNIHGKNNFKVGPIGDHVLDFDLATPSGQLLRCSREENPEIFHAAIGGFGALGAFTRIRLKLKRVESGLLRVAAFRTRTLEENFEVFEDRLPASDYLVGWIDGTASGAALGRGQIHQANYLKAEEDPEGADRTLRLARQGLPSTLLGMPRSLLWHFMKPVFNAPGIRLLNTAKYWAQLIAPKGYFQSHVAFAFLLDYVPNWRRAYGSRGFIQYQPFVPKDAARALFREILDRCQAAGLPPYLVVMKRHRPDPFLLTHALDGYSLAMDFPVPAQPERLRTLCHQLSERVLAAGGKFYFAKDSVLRPQDVERCFGPERLAAFAALKQRLDPRNVLQSDLTRRVFANTLSS